MTSKKDSASESTLSLPPGEELKTGAEKDGNIIYNFYFQKLIYWLNFKIIQWYSLYEAKV